MRPATRRFLDDMDDVAEEWDYYYRHSLHCTLFQLEAMIFAWKELFLDLLTRAERRAEQTHCNHTRHCTRKEMLDYDNKEGG